MAERSYGCSGETFLAPSTREKRLQGKMTKDYYWRGVQENTGTLSKLSLFERLARPMFIKMR